MISLKKYTCNIEKLHTDIQKVYQIGSESSESKKFQKIPIKYSNWTWWIILLLRICGLSHYDVMALLWYDSYLLDRNYIKSLFWDKKRKRLLDIGSGSGTITELFQPYVWEIVCQESSYLFRRRLIKKGLKIYKKWDKKAFDIILMFNVLDRCGDAEKMLKENINRLEKNGLMLISLPFPIQARHGNGLQNSKQKALSQKKDSSFEKGASSFYMSHLKKNNLSLVSFSRLPYIVLNPELSKITTFDNALFVCKKK